MSEPIAAKPVPLFLLHTAFLAVLFTALPLETSYEIAFQSVGNTIFSIVPGERSVEFEWVQPNERSNDQGQLRMTGSNAARSGQSWQAEFSVSDRGRIPTALILAMMLATPMPRAQLVIRSIGAVALFHSLLFAQLGAIAWGYFAAAEGAGSVPLGQAMLRLSPALEGLFRTVVPRFVACFIAWAVFASPARNLETRGIAGQLRTLLGGGGKQPPRGD